jgi:hypothetical protein
MHISFYMGEAIRSLLCGASWETEANLLSSEPTEATMAHKKAQVKITGATYVEGLLE